MQKIIINSIPQETRIAILEDDQLAEVYIEGVQNRRLVGNIIKGRVTKVLPGIEAAFVDVGLQKDAFLYALDAFDNLAAIEGGVDDEEDNGSEESGVSEMNGSGAAREVYHPPIQEILKEGQHILVQVAKEPIGSKGARVTSHINLPGRFLVFMPTVRHIGVSRRIEDEGERERLRALVEQLREPNEGFIIRTLAEDKGEAEFRSDIQLLRNLWQRVMQSAEDARPSTTVYEDSDPIFRIIRDFFTPEVERIVVDTEAHYQRCVEILDALDPSYTNRVKLHVKPTPLFEFYGIETEIERARRRKVWLRSGGYLVIEQTEAMVSIDVNTGKYVGKKNLEETITQTNVEAAREVARQLRLRNLGGIIIVDFIDMEKKENRDKVLQEFEIALRKDRARTNLHTFTKLGLVELTRKRVRRSLPRTLSETCPYCKGEGVIKARNAVCYEIFRQLQKRVETSAYAEIVVRAHPEIAYLLRTDEYQSVQALAEHHQKAITIQGDESLHHEQFDIVVL